MKKYERNMKKFEENLTMSYNSWDGSQYRKGRQVSRKKILKAFKTRRGVITGHQYGVRCGHRGRNNSRSASLLLSYWIAMIEAYAKNQELT